MERNAPMWVTAVLIAGVVVLAVIGVIYLVEPARSLPSFFPGHDAAVSRHHTKHAIAAFGAAVVALVLAWIASGKKKIAQA